MKLRAPHTLSTNGFTQSNTLAGFTLVETLVAITILLLVIIGPMTTAQKGIQMAYFASDQITAVFLAQEAIEAVRALRDSQGLEVVNTPTKNADEWLAIIVSECGSNGIEDSNTLVDRECAYHSNNGSFDSCADSNGCLLNIDSDEKYTHQSTGIVTPSLFTRKVYIKTNSGGQTAVTAIVTWNSPVFGNTNRTVTLQSWIYNQYKRYED